MRKLIPVLAFLLSAPAAGVCQELDRTVLEKLKASSVFVIVQGRQGQGTGSGFIFLKRGSTGYLLTCEHVVRGAETAQIVLGSGTSTERRYEGRVLATDADRDLACLILKNVKDIPAPLEIGTKTDVAETQAVYAAGFPFGRMLAAGEKNPEISITKAAVSSVRRGEDGRVVAVQLSGDVNPGNSGGPIVDARGRVIGVTQSKVFGTSTAFAVPPEELQGFFRGRVSSSSFKPVATTATSVKYDISVGLIDPLGTLRVVTIAWCPEKALGGKEPERAKDGTWGKAHPSMKTVTLKVDEDTATASFDVPRAASEPAEQTLLVQVSFVTGDGKLHWTQPAPLEVEFAAGAGGAATADPKAPAGKDPVPEKAIDVPVADEIKVVSTLKLRAAITELLLSPDGSALYALDLSEGKVYHLKPDTLEVVASADTMESAVAMCLTPDGKTIYVGGRDPGYVSSGKAGNGYVQTISASSMKPTGTFNVPFGIHRLVATNSGTVVVTGSGQWGGLAVIDAQKKSVIGTAWMIYGGSSIRLHPDHSRVYTGTFGSSPGDFHCVPLKKPAGKANNPSGLGDAYESYDSPYHGEHPLGGEFEISSDGRYLVGGYGSVLRLGKTKDADLRFVGKIDRGVAVGIGKGSSTFVVATPEGFLKVYSLPSLELKKSIRVDRYLSRVAMDAAKGRLYAVASAVPSGDTRFIDGRTVPAGDIVSFSLSGK
jgi:hypothetical protein